MTPPRPRRTHKWTVAALVFGLLVLLAVIGAVIAYRLSVRGTSVRAVDLKVGDCVTERGQALPDRVTRGRCDRPHFGEVFAVVPGTDPAACATEFFAYAPDIPDGPVFRVVTVAGQDSVVCVAMADHERWSSLRG